MGIYIQAYQTIPPPLLLWPAPNPVTRGSQNCSDVMMTWTESHKKKLF